jgi:hypothetical protein
MLYTNIGNSRYSSSVFPIVTRLLKLLLNITPKKTKLLFNFLFIKKNWKKKRSQVGSPCDFFLIIIFIIILIFNLKLRVNLKFYKKKNRDINIIVSLLSLKSKEG